MKKRFWLCKRGGVFYIKDALTRKRTSLKTSDDVEADRLFQTQISAAHSRNST